MPLKFAEPTDGAIPLSLIFSDQFEGWRDGLDAAARAWVDASGFRGDPGAALALPAADGSLRAAVGGLGASAMPRRDRFLAARIRAALPDGTYVLAAFPFALRSLSCFTHISPCSIGILVLGRTYAVHCT